MAKKNKLKEVESPERFEATSPQVEFKGVDGGKVGLLTRFVFSPNDSFKELSQEQQDQVVLDALVPQLWKHCEKLGWWPDERFQDKPYRIAKQDDGTYFLMSYLHKGSSVKSKFASELGIGTIGINEK